MTRVITIRPDRESPPGPPQAIEVPETQDPLVPLPIGLDANEELTSPVALRAQTVRRYLLGEPDARRRLVRRGTKGWAIMDVDPDGLRAAQPERVREHTPSNAIDSRVVSRISLHSD